MTSGGSPHATARSRRTPGRRLVDAVNSAAVPLRLVIPQPVIAKVPVLRTNREERFRQALALYRGRALDVGCGTNGLIRAYRSMGGEGIGVDTHPWDGVDVRIEDSRSLPWSDASFDTVSFIASLNHIPERADALREARRVLRPDGRLIVSNLTPKVSRLWHRIAFWDPDQHERSMQSGEAWGFSEEALVRMVEAAGFRLELRRPFMWRLNHIYVFGPDVPRAPEPAQPSAATDFRQLPD